jgi:uncharacterized protein YcbK (DUF882 family)
MSVLTSLSKKTMTNGIRRRELLASCCGLGMVAVLGRNSACAAQSVLGDSGFWAMPRTLSLVRAQTGETLSVPYFADDRVNNEGYLQICTLLRDVQANQAVYIDWHLLDTLRAIQGYMESYGYKKPIIVNSGYRTPQTNAKTEGAARNSMHMHGRAVDFTMPGVPSGYMGALASYFKGGGVGFYPSEGFTHIDTGSVRYWTGGSSASRYPLGGALPR